MDVVLHRKLVRISIEGIAQLHSEPNLRFFRWIRFFAKCLWPIGYVTLQKIKPAKKSLNLARKASFAIPSIFFLLAIFPIRAEIYYEGTNTFRGYNKVDLNWMVQFLPYNPVIFEAGAYHGEETLYAAKIWPKGKIIACEPNPRAYQELQNAIVQNDIHNITPYPFALNSYSGLAILYLTRGIDLNDPAAERDSSLLPHVSTVQDLTIQVPCMVLDAWCQANNIDHIDVLNLNTEGLELDILQSSPQILKTVKLIILPSFFYSPRLGTPNYFTVKDVLTKAHFVPLAHWYEPTGRGRAVYISQELYDAYFVKCLGLGLGGIAYP